MMLCYIYPISDSKIFATILKIFKTLVLHIFEQKSSYLQNLSGFDTLLILQHHEFYFHLVMQQKNLVRDIFVSQHIL